MPTFCRHNRLVQNCPICSRELSIELRPILSSSAPRSTERPSTQRPVRQESGGGRRRSGAPPGVRVRRLERAVDDGFHSPLVPGLRSSGDAERLADELAFAATRLDRLEREPPGLYAEVAAAGDPEERAWLAFQIAYLCPLDGPEPFAAIAEHRTAWASDETPSLDDVQTGPRSAHAPDGGARTLRAYRDWARRAGSQAAAFEGESSWTPERRFDRVYERLALPSFHRDARFELLVTLGRLGVFPLRAGALRLGAGDDVTLAAKRTLGIGDTLLLERRAAELAEACSLPLEALDVGLYNWGRGRRSTLGLGEEDSFDPPTRAVVAGALGL